MANDAGNLGVHFSLFLEKLHHANILLNTYKMKILWLCIIYYRSWLRGCTPLNLHYLQDAASPWLVFSQKEDKALVLLHVKSGVGTLVYLGSQLLMATGSRCIVRTKMLKFKLNSNGLLLERLRLQSEHEMNLRWKLMLPIKGSPLWQFSN